MDKYLGAVYRLHRLECGMKLRHVADRCGISASKLSNFENDKVSLSSNIIQELYSVLNIKVNLDERKKYDLEQAVISFYHDITYHNHCINEHIEKFKQMNRIVQYTDAYFILLLHNFVYRCFFLDRQFDYEKNEKNYSHVHPCV